MTSIDEQINKQYSPRFWSQRMPENEILEHHTAFISSASETIKTEIPCIQDVQYGKKTTNLMDIFGTDLEKDAPILVFVHGGYWQIYTKNENSYVAKPLWKHKIKTYVPDYDLVPKVTLEEIVKDIQIMAKHVLEMGTEHNSRGVWFCGHSAGAHLAATLLDDQWLSTLTQNCRKIFKGLILISGVYDLEPLLKTEQNAALKLNSSRAILLSPLHNVKNLIQKSLLNKDFNILVAVAEHDSPEFIRQSFTYFEKLKEVYCNVEYRLMLDLDHFNIVEHLADDQYILSEMIVSLIKGPINHQNNRK